MTATIIGSVGASRDSRPLAFRASDWVAAVGDTRASKLFSSRRHIRLGRSTDGNGAGGPALFLFTDAANTLPALAERGDVVAVFDGVLHNAHALRQEVAVPAAASDAELILSLFLRRGDAFADGLIGEFVLLIWDGRTASLRVARDPLGMQPLYRTVTSEWPVVSPSAVALRGCPGVSRALDRSVLADWLCQRWPAEDETFHSAIHRVPSGTVVRLRGPHADARRYWDPAPPGQPMKWLERDEVDGFDALFEKVVARAMGTDRVGVYLSGGLDSISVAAMAGDVARRRSGERPMALSLAFPSPCDESAIQSAVADALGFDRELLPFDEAVGTRGLFARALELGATWPMPMTNLWNPAYAALASRGAGQGCRTILTGRGGDEWLTLSPCYAADLIARADVPGLWRLMRGVRSSRDYPWRQILRRTFWTFGLRPLLGQLRARVAPGAWRVHHERRAEHEVPDWVAPDPALRRQLSERSRRRLTPQDSSNGFYVRDMRHGLLHPLVGLDLEDSWEMGRRLGLRIRHPFWDAELVDFLFRVPPKVLNQPRPAKWLVRETVSRRFPGLGLDRQKKVAATGVFTARLVEEAPRLWTQMGGPRCLAEFGVVDRGRLEAGLGELIGSGDVMKLTTIWRIMNLENWARNQPV